tara:strand:+ start:732 stop:926 length:195 start_codon:yes stop_codon:yes gene_type:complete
MGKTMSKLCGGSSIKIKKKINKMKKNLSRDRRAEIIYREIRMEDFESDSDEEESIYGFKNGIGI